MANESSSPNLTLVARQNGRPGDSFKAALRVTDVGPDLFKIKKEDWDAAVGPAFERMCDQFSFAATAPETGDAQGIRRHLACLSCYAGLFGDIAESVMIDGRQLDELKQAADRALTYCRALNRSRREGNVIHLGLKKQAINP